MNAQASFGIGLVGCGAFGEFCLEAFRTLEGVHVAAVADVRPAAAKAFGERFGVPAFTDADDLLACGDVDLVHLATPPSSHHEIVLRAAKAGKHVLCEKPLAMNAAHAREMLTAMEAAGRVCPVNFVLRYNETTETVKRLLDSGLLGAPLSARLTNCAADSNLQPGHWFWDKAVGGGIFIEHGVHFFDLYRHWFGDGEVVGSHVETHAATGRESRVTCNVRHDNGVIASHYHGFDQVAMMDRTDHRIVCELGDIRVNGWIPLEIEIFAAVGAAKADELSELCGGAAIETVETFDLPESRTSGRTIEHTIDKTIRLRYCPNADKQAVYAASVRDLLADQLAYVRDASHRRRVEEINGLAAVTLAETAEAGATRGEA